MASSPENKSKAMTNQPSRPMPSLPDDLLLSCFARVSRSHYPTLSLVSKKFQSLIASPQLYKIRSSLGRTESSLYVCFTSDHNPNPNPNPLWFTLCLKPNQNLTNRNVLVPTSIPHSAPPHWSGLISGPSNDIYNIGGPIDNAPSSGEARSLWVDPTISVLDRKVYVTRRSSEDKDTQTWEEPDGPPTFLSLVVREKFYIFNGLSSNDLGYKPKGCQWERFWGWKPSWGWFSCCVIDKVLYRYRSESFKWYDAKAGGWRKLKGLSGLPKFVSYGFQLAGYGGKLAVLWAELVWNGGDKEKLVWCAVIALERCESGGAVWGKVEWCDVVCTVPKTYQLEYALDAIV